MSCSCRQRLLGSEKRTTRASNENTVNNNGLTMERIHPPVAEFLLEKDPRQPVLLLVFLQLFRGAIDAPGLKLIQGGMAVMLALS